MGATIVDEFTVPKAKAAGATSFASKLTLALGALRRTLASAAISPWKWMAITCSLMAISWGLREWRNRQFEGNSTASKECPFPLSELPKELGGWTMDAGTEVHLDRETAQIAGSSDNFIRTYAQNNSGERVSVMILYGLARSVFAHNAEVCLPTVGFRPNGPSTDDELTLPGSGKTAHYRVGYYSRKQAGIVESLAILYSFRHDGEWLPDASDRWKKFRSHPGMFKIQIQRQGNELAVETDPSVSLLGDFIQEIERRLAQIPATPAN